MSTKIHAAFAVAATLVVGFAVAWGFVLAGSPTTRRLQLLDEHRVEDLRAIVRSIEERNTSRSLDGTRKLTGSLPKTLDEAAKQARSEKISIRDPETDEPYDYAIIADHTLRLCAVFARARTSNNRVFWNHPAGRHCYTINVLDPPP
jgi:hypothetical protein